MASLILGISGKKRSGKDTFAERLVDAHGFTRIAFADPLKAVAARLNPLIEVWPDEAGRVYGPGTTAVRPFYLRLRHILELAGWEQAKEVREVRRLLQNLGVAMREEVGMGVWVDAAMRRARDVGGPVVIPDVRFNNEVLAILNQRGAVIRIERPGQESTDTHVSETELDEWRHLHTVVNDGTIEELHTEADNLVRPLAL